LGVSRAASSGIVKIMDDFVELTGTYLQRIPEEAARLALHPSMIGVGNESE